MSSALTGPSATVAHGPAAAEGPQGPAGPPGPPLGLVLAHETAAFPSGAPVGSHPTGRALCPAIHEPIGGGARVVPANLPYAMLAGRAFLGAWLGRTGGRHLDAAVGTPLRLDVVAFCVPLD